MSGRGSQRRGAVATVRERLSDHLWRWRERLRALLRRSRVEREVADEMAFHLEMERRERLAAGDAPAAARRGAGSDFGGVERWREEVREARWGHRLELAARHLRQAARALARHPGLPVAVALTLAVGIAAATLMAGLARGTLLAPLPWDRAGDAVWLQVSWRGAPRAAFSPAELVDLEERLTRAPFAAAGGYSFGAVNLALPGAEPRRLRVAGVTPGVLPALGVAPVAGRGFRRDDELADAPVALVTPDFARELLGAAGAALGRELLLAGEPHEVVGVLPAGFRLPEELFAEEPVRVLVPQGLDPAEIDDRGSHYLSAVARLAPGATRAEAAAAVDGLVAAFAAEHPADYPEAERFRIDVVPLAEEARRPVARPLAVLAAAVLFLLAVTAVDAAGLLLLRTRRRSRELALRAVVGAGRRGLLAAVVVEGLLLAAAGGAAGAALAVALRPGLEAWLAAELPWRVELPLGLPTLGGALALAALCGVGAALLPALRAASAPAGAALSSGDRTAGDRRGRRALAALAVAEVAVALVLVVGAGFLGRSLLTLAARDPGFRTAGVATARLDLPPAEYDDGERVGFYRELTAGLAEAPGVEAAGALINLPLSGPLGDLDFVVDGRPVPPGRREPWADWQVATPGALEALGVELVAGRLLDRRDRAGAPGAVVVSESFVARHFPEIAAGSGEAGGAAPRGSPPAPPGFASGGAASAGGSPGAAAVEAVLGRRLRFVADELRPREVEIVGVVGDVRHAGLDAEPRPQIYLAHEQFRFWGSGRAVAAMSLVVRSPRPPAELRAEMAARVHRLDPALPLAAFRTLEEVRRASVAVPRLLATGVAAFSAVAWLLAAVAVATVMGRAVAERRAEIGVRLAFGATPGEVSREILGAGLRLAGLGLVLGGALAATALLGLRGSLVGVTPTDPLPWVAAAALLLLTGLAASWWPARRASRVDPVALLRR